MTFYRGQLSDDQEWDYDPEPQEETWEEDGDRILGPHGYHKNCMCYSCNPPG